MAWMSVLGYCYCCKRPFHFNANLVPSYRVDGERQPICRDCIERANAKRKETGLAPLEILPGAYDPEEVA